MPKVIDLPQGSDEWHQARCGVITASEFHKVLAKGQGKVRRSYLMEIVGERITECPKESFTTPAMERGHEQEPIARELYEVQTGNEVTECGFMLDGDYGYSPDGIIGDDGLIEIKSKASHLQAEILLSGEVPSQHYAQLQGGLFVSGRQWIDFVSFCPSMPLFVKRVTRDIPYIVKLQSELDDFNEEAKEYEEIIGGMW